MEQFQVRKYILAFQCIFHYMSFIIMLNFFATSIYNISFLFISNVSVDKSSEFISHGPLKFLIGLSFTSGVNIIEGDEVKGGDRIAWV